MNQGQRMIEALKDLLDKYGVESSCVNEELPNQYNQDDHYFDISWIVDEGASQEDIDKLIKGCASEAFCKMAVNYKESHDGNLPAYKKITFYKYKVHTFMSKAFFEKDIIKNDNIIALYHQSFRQTYVQKELKDQFGHAVVFVFKVGNSDRESGENNKESREND